MEVIYRAKDGKIFEDEADCFAYERKNGISGFTMYDEDGNLTEDTAMACYLYIQSPSGALDFISQCGFEGTDSAGVLCDCGGFYHWVDGGRYEYLSEETMKFLDIVYTEAQKGKSK